LLTRKAQNVTTATAGGFLVANDIGRQIEFALRAASVCIRAGARVLPGLRSDLTLGRETQEVTYDWLAELEESFVRGFGIWRCAFHTASLGRPHID
jgi:hypothetical protein